MTRTNLKSKKKRIKSISRIQENVERNPLVKNPEEMSSWSFCQNKIYENYKIKECGGNCYASELRKINKHFSDFVKTGWASKTLSEIKLDQVKLDNKIQKFFVAVAYSDLFSGIQSYDFIKSELLFKELVQLDSRNSYVYYFYAYVLQKNGKNEEAKLILNKAKSLNKFNSYMEAVSFTNHKLSLVSPSLYLLATEFYSTVPYPDFRKLISLKGIDVDIVRDFADKLVKAGLESSGKDANRVSWSIVEYTAGIRLYSDLNLKEALVLPRYDEIMRRNNNDYDSYDFHIDKDHCVKSFELSYAELVKEFKINPPK